MFCGAGTRDSRAIHGAPKFAVGMDYFGTLGIPILRGRGFRKEDETNVLRSVPDRLAA
jgi:hypothetical protein